MTGFHSLALVAPDEVSLYEQMSTMGRAQVRGRFTLSHGGRARLYDLSLTDPHWRNRVSNHGPQVLRQTDGRFLLTISLGEPLGLYCYKLVAAIVVLPAALAASF